MIELTIRLVFSLCVVLGLLLLCARVAGRRFQGRRDALVQVVHRQPIGRHAAVSVVNVGGRVLVLGTTDQEVRLLTELDPDELLADTDDDTLLTLVTDREADRPAPAVPAPTPRTFPAAVLAETPARPGRHVAPRRGPRAHQAPVEAGRPGALAGSVLSARTWRQAWGAVTGQAS